MVTEPYQSVGTEASLSATIKEIGGGDIASAS